MHVAAVLKCSQEPTGKAAADPAKWEDQAVLNLATAGLQNEVKDWETYGRIAYRARVLAALVPENLWTDIQWTDDEE